MEKIFNKNSSYVKITIVLIAVILLIVFQSLGLLINKNIENAFYKIRGEVQPDENIVLIHITKNDFENLGSWPLKRNYYALLINQLSKLDVKAIGLNIFLSDRISSQSVYNQLLNDEIKKSGKVVLTSIINNYNETRNSGEILIPEPKKVIANVETGHSNYFDKNGIIVPLTFRSMRNTEKAISVVLAEKSGFEISAPALMKLNFTSSWKKFKNYSVLEFFELIESNSPELKKFKNKIVIIGISDPQIASNISSAFDHELHGLGLQAFALDNLIQQRFITTKYWKLSSIIFGIIIFTLIFIRRKVFTKYLVIFSIVMIVNFVLFIFFNIQLQYYIFIFPFLFLLLFEIITSIYEKRIYLQNVENETNLLKKNLHKKEKELFELQKEFDLSENADSNEVKIKILNLKKEITELKLKQKDEIIISDELTEAENFHGIIYKSKIMKNVVDLIKKVGPQAANVLILGESGTGKELVARAIHQLNEKRKDNNFVAVNCAALSETLLESELFGHVKGAFTNAVNDKAGRFETADKGTIFLDEIGETSENFQVKLLRVLQTGEFENVGSSKTIKVDVRIVAATNKNLEKLVKEKKFREDLYYRLNVIKIELPTLRNRKDDIKIIAEHFIKNEEVNFTISQAVIEQLMNHDWQGNVRELESVIKRAVIFAKSENRNIIKLSDIPDEILDRSKLNMDDLILNSLRERNFSHSSISEISKELNLSRTAVSENFRGNIFKVYCENNFNLQKTAEIISGDSIDEALEKVISKIETFLNNIKNDVLASETNDFESIKLKLNSKYKNLPQKYHLYLDEIIKDIIKKA